MKIKKLLLFTLTVLTLSNCKKNSDNSLETLTTKTWKRALNDKNPLTNPPGANQNSYGAIQDCDLDDTFKFQSNGNLIINRGSNKCSQSEIYSENQTYTIDRTKKEIYINGEKYFLAEESKVQIKYYRAIPATTGFNYIILLLQ
ncbi:hypothetical protein A5893_11130 [Pedobacter psychrophilus]|uniref:Lipocalin-like domain-containing protein n=1 Tax=Pedobacter psychrophilus TaxID=1826909 RepID=A0A179DEG8_9SPHI|nr:hypothetical protein [Pedobacter psychrophilus]OAQ39212.1 hypothetical protein A5893_11130 [Pedobacter psychrophilus]